MSAVPRKTLGRFEIVRVLGKGAMGVVYEGRDPRLNRRVAIKTILRSAIGDEEEAREYAQRFVREAQAVARLSHPNVVGVYDFGEEGDVTFIVMEFLDGRDLKSYFDAGHRFDFPTIVRMMNELLDGLGYAHRQGVIHRDVKPANIMIDSAGRVKLTDFGVARITESTDRTQAGTMVGTPSYMSPEQIQGLPVDNRTDLFACGVILYQLLTGERPFAGSGTWTIYNQILQQEPPAPTSLNAALPPEIDRVVSRALAKNRDERFRDAQEFSAALTTLLLGTAPGDGSVDADATRFLLPSDAIRLAESAAQRRADRSGTSGTFPGAQGTVPPGLVSQAGQTSQAGQEIELEFWRSIKDSIDPADYELYLEQFPAGIYAELARRKAQRLRNPGDVTGDRSAPGRPAPHLPQSSAADAAADVAGADDATVVAGTQPGPASPAARTERQPTGERPAATGTGRPSYARLGAAAAVVLIALVAGSWALFGLRGEQAAPPPVAVPAPGPPAQATPTPATPRPPADPPAADATADGTRPKADDDAVRRIESALDRANAEAEKAALEKAAAERAAAEKAAAKAAADRAAAEKAAAAARAAAERAAADREAAAQAGTARAAAEQAARDKAVAEKLAAERAAAEKAAADRAAAEQAAAAARAAALKVAAEKAAAEKAAAERALAEQAAVQRVQTLVPPPATGTTGEPAKRAGGRQN